MLKTKRVPPLPCGEVVEIVCNVPGTQFTTCVLVKVMPSTVKLWPAGDVCTVMATVVASEIAMLQFAVVVSGVPEVESVTCPVNEFGPAVFGVPVIAPVAGFRMSGEGSEPAEIAYVYPGVPPVATSADK